MITPVTQRWRDRRGTYRPAGETIRTQDYEVAALDEKTAKAFVVQHHYSSTFPSARARIGLYRGAVLTGVAVFSHPMSEAVLAGLPGERLQRVELGRFVLLDDVPGNGETFFLARAFDLLRADGFETVKSFSDPMPRDDADGERVFRGHVGTIYQASNAAYLGRTDRRTLRLLADGRAYSARAASKVRAGEQGRGYSGEQLVAYGATPLRVGEDTAAWLRLWRARLTRPVRHPGNHVYLFGLSRSSRKAIEKLAVDAGSPAYPKFDLRAA